MPRKTTCKVCTSQYKDEVNFMLLKNSTLTSIQYFLESKGLKISATSIGRHRDNHPPEDKSKPSKEKDTRKKRATKESKNPKSTMKKTEQVNEDVDIINDENADKTNSDAIKRQQEILREYTEDIDIIREFMVVMSLQKERAERAQAEEDEVGAILPTTGTAIADYKKSIVDFHKITNGMESIKHLRFAELSIMITNLFAKQCLTDQTRYELLQLIKLFKPEYKDANTPPITMLPMQNQMM